jgi:hypothetical protein
VFDEARRLRRRAAWHVRCAAVCRGDPRPPTRRASDRSGGAVQAPERRRRCGSSITRRNADSLARKFASSPAPCQSDGRGLRRGLDGPSMPPLLLKNGECLSPPALVLARRGGRGLVSQAVAPRRWASSARIRRSRARRARVARTSFIERPRKSRPSRPDFRWPHAGETSPCPPCRRQASGLREAHDAHSPRGQPLQHQHLEWHRMHGKDWLAANERGNCDFATEEGPASATPAGPSRDQTRRRISSLAS